MSQEWMIDVLTDLRKFAQQNGLMGLAEQLDETIHVAATDLMSTKQATEATPRDANKTGNLYRAYAAGDIA